MLCVEQKDEWLVGRRYLSRESIGAASRSPSSSRRRAIALRPDRR
jgi:hypothetical protein